MAERSSSQENTWLLIPFYTDPSSPDYQRQVDKFAAFAAGAKDVSGLPLAVVDDGSRINPEQFAGTVDRLLILPQNRGKAAAVREGLRDLLEGTQANFVVQYDSDGDQPFVAVPSVHQRLIEVSEGNPDIPTLVIGDRYSEGLQTPPNPESVVYRQSILMFFGALSSQFGFSGVRDWVSGARGYSARYIRHFLDLSRSSRYGIESEQLVIAGLVGGRVGTAPLSDSRPRDPWTLTNKWLQNFDVYVDHEEELRAMGQGHTIDVVFELVRNLRAEKDVFKLDLTPLGEDTRMRFTRLGDRYTAEIPAEHRARLFTVRNGFPFAIVN